MHGTAAHTRAHSSHQVTEIIPETAGMCFIFMEHHHRQTPFSTFLTIFRINYNLSRLHAETVWRRRMGIEPTQALSDQQQF